MTAHPALALIAASLVAVAPSSHAALAPYTQGFEGMALAEALPGNNTALADDGWLGFVNVFEAHGAFAYQYGTFPAPNGQAAVSGITTGEGGAAQGSRQLVVYSDYANRAAHGSGQWVQTNVYQERTLSAADIGTTWVFQFDARFFGLASPSTAQAFITTRDPANGFQVVDSNSVDMGNLSSSWASYTLPLTITAGAGQILQFGFANMARNDDPSAVIYDNISLMAVPEPSGHALMLAGLGVIGLLARLRRQ